MDGIRRTSANLEQLYGLLGADETHDELEVEVRLRDEIRVCLVEVRGVCATASMTVHSYKERWNSPESKSIGWNAGKMPAASGLNFWRNRVRSSALSVWSASSTVHR